MFKKGNKVEVWNRREVPSGSWWSAEIISGDGHHYSVRYDGYPTDSSVAVDRLPRKAIRPCPPPVGSLKDVMSGDVVEVFDNNSWKLAQVLLVIDENHCFVRLLGSSGEFAAHKSQIRTPLSWQGDKWVTIDKDSGKQNGGMPSSHWRGGKSGYHIVQSCVEIDNSAQKTCFPIENHDFSKKTEWRFCRGTKKRAVDISFPAELCNYGRRKMRAIKKDGRNQGITSEHTIRFMEKLDDVASSEKVLDGKYVHSSFNNRTSSKVDSGRGIPSSDKQNHLVRISGPSDAESTSSSVGSCSVSSSPCRSSEQYVIYPSGELYGHSDHAETYCGLENESSLPRKDLQEEIHQLELNAYRSTLIALYASGPISWEWEAFMTNLRLMLNISNDEHLMEIRNLIRSEIATTIS
ncbi:unnamed protein product [Musa acuminata subsp. malaccensis]|uniref:(wild Malaysian banana) hypothetical protein n=1 Tax=Musa acuminata subsp. malaccensis TaxID=214687 RepID=A0A804JDA6_MUSAM|nr:PREDICTED: uncharacterized protein LOC103986974 [Musa acuminata subsp. malaccensis]CAG1845455.1 unnamed protein product [Musa acuminata subsp. malaccensis]